MRHARWLTLALVAILLALMAVPTLGAGQDGPRWTQFHMQDGLPSDTVWAIAANPEGDVWLGTSQGASLYRDGRWYTYTQAHGLGADWVAALAIDAQQRVWFGTSGGGLSVLDGQEWRTYDTDNSGLGSDWVSALSVDPQGNVWVGTWGHGVSRFDGTTWQTFDSSNTLLPSDFVTALAAGPNGELWVGLHGQGLARFSDGQWRYFSEDEGLPDLFVEALAVAPDGTLWAGSSEGLTCFDADGKALRTYTTDDGLPDNHINALAFGTDGQLWAGTGKGAAVLDGGQWQVYQGPETLAHDYVSAIAAGPQGVWFGSLSNGVAWYGAGTTGSTRRLPVVLVHGWHSAYSDRLEDSEFRFMANWLRADGYPVYYAQGISPENTLHQNAAHLRDAIDQAKKESGAARVTIIAFSMGGLNTRAYLESSLYAGDVDQAFIMGTPEVGVRTWYPFLLRDFQNWARDPSAIELTPEYASLFNSLHTDGAGVPYVLIAGDARQEELPETVRGLPPGDALISAGSALALQGPTIERVLTDDLHAFSDETILLGVPSYLWPRRTYDAYIRNRLRLGPDQAVPGVPATNPPEITPPDVPTHSPFYDDEVEPGQTVTHTVLVDTRGEVRFYLRGQSASLDFALVDPSGNRIDADNIGDQGEHFDLGMDNMQGYLLHQAAPGAWQVVIGLPQDAAAGTSFAGYATLTSPLRLSTNTAPAWPGQGEPVAITATLQSGSRAVSQAVVQAEVGRPDGQVDRLTLLDDGAHGDGAAQDGVYGGTYRPGNLGGWYTLFVTAMGSDQGTEYARTAEHVFCVSPDTASLTGIYSEEGEDADLDGRFDALKLEAGVDVRAQGDFLLAATLTDSQGRELGRVVEPLTLDPGRQTVTLRFPGRVVAQAGIDGPYTISRVMLLDESGAAIPLQEAAGVLTTRPYRYQDFEGS